MWGEGEREKGEGESEKERTWAAPDSYCGQETLYKLSSMSSQQPDSNLIVLILKTRKLTLRNVKIINQKTTARKEQTLHSHPDLPDFQPVFFALYRGPGPHTQQWCPGRVQNESSQRSEGCHLCGTSLVLSPLGPNGTCFSLQQSEFQSSFTPIISSIITTWKN